MTSTPFDRASERFEELLALPADEREAALAGLGETESEEVLALVRSMLAGEQSTRGRLDTAALEGLATPIPDTTTADVAIGGYEILGVLGQGGMGVVYEARQVSPRRTVALKILRAGFVTPELLRRFRHEADVLGWLNHPGIAQVYEAGTDGTGPGARPFIAMELVRGERIDRYVERRALPLRARVELIAALCDAVQHAHRKGVIHRDLKPANVLVTDDGRLKVLDFGIARLTDSDLATTTRHTRMGEVLGTLPYMSPEQVGGDPAQVDTRSDVYALGVVAYELLAGQRPLELGDSGLAHAARVIAEDEPTTLGALDPRLRGDLEVIVGKALAKEKERRYASAEEMAQDLRRHLADRPILARPPTRLEQLAKFARRNRGLVGGVAVAFLVLLAGTVVSTVMALDKARLLDEKEVEVKTANEVVGFLESLFAQSDPFADEDLTVRDVARRAAARIGTEFADRPRIRGRLLNLLGKVFNDLDLHTEAEPLLVEALALRGEQFGTESVEYAEPLERLARVYQLANRLDEAEAMFREVLAIRQARLGPGTLTASALNNLSGPLISRGRWDEVDALLSQALAMHREHSGEDDPRTISTLVNIAVVHWERGRLAEAEEVFREVVAIDTVETRRLRIDALMMLGHCLRSQLRRTEAEEYALRALEMAEEHYGPDARITRQTRNSWANLLSDLGRADEAAAIMAELHEQAVALRGADSVDAVSALHDLAFAVHETPRRAEAEFLYLDAIDGFREVHGPDHPAVFMAMHNLSVLYMDLGRMDEALELEREALAGRVRVIGEADPQTLTSWIGLGNLLFRTGALDEAVDVRRRILALVQPTQGDHSRLTQDARIDLANVLVRAGEHAEAEALLEEAWAAVDGMPDPGGTPRRIASRFVDLYRATRDDEKAEHWRTVDVE